MSLLGNLLRGGAQAAGVAGQFVQGYGQDQATQAARVLAQAKAQREAENDRIANLLKMREINTPRLGDANYAPSLAGAEAAKAGAVAPIEVQKAVDIAKGVAPIRTQEAIETAKGVSPITTQTAINTAKGVSPITTQTAVNTAAGLAPIEQRTHAADRLFDVEHPTTQERAPNEGEIKGAAFVHRIIPAGQLVNQYGERKALDAIAAKAGMFGNWATSPEGQKLRQAGEQWVYSVLRPESGAAISPKEFESYEKTFLPTPFDDDATLAQKAAARRTAEESVAIQAGRALPSGSFTSAAQADSAARAPRRPPGYRP